ncbi:MAG: TolC family protein [Desulfobacteraceae bacterium]
MRVAGTAGYRQWRKCLVACGLMALAIACSPAGRWTDRRSEDPALWAGTAAHISPESIAAPREVAAEVTSSGPLRITVAEAVLLCLENNRALVVQRINPSIRQTSEDQERAAYDPTVGVDITTGRERGERLARSGSRTEAYTIDTTEGLISLEQYFPTGTTVSLEAGAEMNDSSLYEDKFYTTRLGMTINQVLLRGRGTDANLARLRQAKIDTRLSEYELRGYTEALVAEVERTCWDYALARRQIEIVEESLKVARQQLDETKQLIDVGRLARAELAAVQAEVAAQEQALIEARADEESLHLHLLRLLNPSGPGLWQREVDLVHQPTLPEVELEDVELHVAVSKRMRPAINQARLEIQRGELEVIKTRNGLMPLMDLFITLGKSGYANTFGHAVDNLDEDSYYALAGIKLKYPFFNRSAKALHRRALLGRQQAQHALENLSQLVEVDVRTAYIEVDRNHRQISASSVTRKFDEEKLRIETEKLRVGKSTSFLVAQAQRDLLASRIAEVRALVNYLKALIDLYRLDGTLLERRGIAAPGREPVQNAAR